MKKLALLALVLVLVFTLSLASADTYYVDTANGGSLNLRSAKDNSVIARIPNGTRLETDDNLSTELSAWVTYNGKSGYVRWEFLSKTPGSNRSSSSSSKSSPTNTQPPASYAATADAGEGDISIQAIGATLQYSSNGKGYGPVYTTISYDWPEEVVITADRTPDYWVINGIRYDFEPAVPKNIVLYNVWDTTIIEAVPKNTASYTLLTPDDIQAFRTDDQLVAQAIHSKLCHVTSTGYGAGGWIDWFDFTDNYINRATNNWEEGGQLSTRIRATIPKGQKISYWRFNDMYLDFSTDVTQFYVHTLNQSMEYEPIFGSKISTASVQQNTSTAARPAITPAPTAIASRPTANGTVSRITPTPDRYIGQIETHTTIRGQITPTPVPDLSNIRPRVTATPTPTSDFPYTVHLEPGLFTTPTLIPARPRATATPTPTPYIHINPALFITPTPDTSDTLVHFDPGHFMPYFP